MILQERSQNVVQHQDLMVPAPLKVRTPLREIQHHQPEVVIDYRSSSLQFFNEDDFFKPFTSLLSPSKHLFNKKPDPFQLPHHLMNPESTDNYVFNHYFNDDDDPFKVFKHDNRGEEQDHHH